MRPIVAFGKVRARRLPSDTFAASAYVRERMPLAPVSDSVLLPAGYPRPMTSSLSRLRSFARRPPQPVQDVILAVFVGMMQVQGTLQVAGNQGVILTTRDHAVIGPLLFGSGLILAVRRRFPVTVFAAVGALSVVYYLAGYPDGPGWVALFVAVYTLTAHGDGARSTRIAVWGLAILTVVWVLTADRSDPARAGWLFFRIGTAVMATTLGESVRARRMVALQAQELARQAQELAAQAQELAAQAQERAERAERTREQEASRRVDAERLRIAREVHDTVAHAIAIINVQAGVTAHVLDKRPEQARDTLRTIEQTSARALRELRSTLEMLTDSCGEENRSPLPGLAHLDDLVGRAREAGLEVSVEIAGAAPELPSALDSAAYRILQESLTNVIRHAGPSRVRIGIRYGESELRVTVTDNGCGSPVQPGPTGRGIAGMRERCELLGGHLTAGPGLAGGFEVLAVMPWRPELVPAA